MARYQGAGGRVYVTMTATEIAAVRDGEDAAAQRAGMAAIAVAANKIGEVSGWNLNRSSSSTTAQALEGAQSTFPGAEPNVLTVNAFRDDPLSAAAAGDAVQTELEGLDNKTRIGVVVRPHGDATGAREFFLEALLGDRSEDASDRDSVRTIAYRFDGVGNKIEGTQG